MIHIDYRPLDNCQSIEDTYGEICVKCNKCGRFNKKCCVCGKTLTPDSEVIYIEFWDVFCDFACKEHEEMIKKMTDDKYEDKYMIHQHKKDFLKCLLN